MFPPLSVWLPAGPDCAEYWLILPLFWPITELHSSRVIFPQTQRQEEEFPISGDICNAMGHRSHMAASHFWKHTRVNITWGLSLRVLEMHSAHTQRSQHADSAYAGRKPAIQRLWKQDPREHKLSKECPHRRIMTELHEFLYFLSKFVFGLFTRFYYQWHIVFYWQTAAIHLSINSIMSVCTFHVISLRINFKYDSVQMAFMYIVSHLEMIYLLASFFWHEVFLGAFSFIWHEKCNLTCFCLCPPSVPASAQPALRTPPKKST